MIIKKEELGYSYKVIAKKSGIPECEVKKVLSREDTDPDMVTVAALNKAFSFDLQSFVNEDPTPYGLFDGTGALNKGQWGDKTIDDYLKLPEGVRVELIDGVFYDMAAPTTVHQMIAQSISSILLNYIKDNKGKCVPFIAPTDVQLDCDDKTIVQPDVLVVCDRKKITKPRIVGAPDLVIEVLSESNWYNDVFRKYKKYQNAGVREYWIVFPDQLKIQVYNFEKKLEAVEYTFKDKVPVVIWDGKCVVDFSEIYEEIKFLF